MIWPIVVNSLPIVISIKTYQWKDCVWMCRNMKQFQDLGDVKPNLWMLWVKFELMMPFFLWCLLSCNLRNSDDNELCIYDIKIVTYFSCLVCQGLFVQLILNSNLICFSADSWLYWLMQSDVIWQFYGKWLVIITFIFRFFILVHSFLLKNVFLKLFDVFSCILQIQLAILLLLYFNQCSQMFLFGKHQNRIRKCHLKFISKH